MKNCFFSSFKTGRIKKTNLLGEEEEEEKREGDESGELLLPL